jgi:myo-inositol-1(or 4)-monophosphatase
MTERDPLDLKKLVESTLAVVAEASALVNTMLGGTVANWQKIDDSPVTEIDIAVDKFLRPRLTELLPSAGWLSEETVDNRERDTKRHVWIVDPIDGTRSLLNNQPEYAISVALAERGVGPVVGVVHNPSTGEAFAACRGGGAWQVGGGVLRCATHINGTPMHLLVSRTELEKGMWNDLPSAGETRGVSSLAYKLALVARGDADATMTPWQRHEWDAAAGDLLVTEAGGRMADATGTPIAYNRVNPKLDGVIGCSAEAWHDMMALAPELRRRREVVKARYGV